MVQIDGAGFVGKKHGTLDHPLLLPDVPRIIMQ
jgi:hypothetical protein